MSNRALRAQSKAVDMGIEELFDWWVDTKFGENPIEMIPDLAEDRKTYRGKILRWMEPWIPGIKNKVLIEEAFGDSWTLRVEFLEQKAVTL